jgi:uncharacterized protein YndB with AHSA1/START domain
MTLTLPSGVEICLTRCFEAPRQRVFDAWTQPASVRQWWGPRSSTMLECAVDPRPGGTFQYVLGESVGVTYTFQGEYLEVRAPERLVHTFVFEPMPTEVSVITVLFEVLGERTRVVETTRTETQEVRDRYLHGGLEASAAETFDRLAELLDREAPDTSR